MILMYIMLFINETCAFRLICFFDFTVDNGGSEQTERMKSVRAGGYVVKVVLSLMLMW